MSAGYDTVVLVIADDDAPSRECAELWLRDRMAGWPDHEVLLVGLVVGELLDNAQRYGSPRYVLELVLDRWVETLTIRLRNEVSVRTAGWTPGTGLLIVGALTEQWGVVALEDSTTVWAKVRFDG